MASVSYTGVIATSDGELWEITGDAAHGSAAITDADIVGFMVREFTREHGYLPKQCAVVEVNVVAVNG